MKTYALWGLLAATVAGAAQADSAAIQRCRSVAEASARLACYDAIALPGIGSRAGWGAPAGAAATAAPPTAAPGAAAPSPASSFGLPPVRNDAAADQLESRIVGLVETFPKGTRYQLENGQVWQVTETTMGFYQITNPKVTITRGLLGNFFMQIEGVSAAPKVRRVQ